MILEINTYKCLLDNLSIRDRILKLPLKFAILLTISQLSTLYTTEKGSSAQPQKYSLSQRLLRKENLYLSSCEERLKIINKNDVALATRWSAFSEILAKIISPCLNLILVRILTPEAFGIAATVMMIVSFADLFANSGFGKFLIQHEFVNNQEKNDYANTAFFANLVVSCILFVILVSFGERIATLVGSSGYGDAVSITSILLILTPFSSIQTALFRRELLFKKLLIVRIIGTLMPLFITIPLALMGFGYRALLAGYIMKELVTSIVLTVQSPWKPKLQFSLLTFKKMFNFSAWSMMETLGQWIRENLPVAVVSVLLTSVQVGLYKTTMTTVNSICALVYSIIVSVVYPILSRYQDNKNQFDYYLYVYFYIGGMLLVPIGVGVWMFSEIVTNILLGSQWIEIASFLGFYTFCFSMYSAISPISFEAFRAIGKPALSALVYLIQNGLLIGMLLLFSKNGFKAICDITAVSMVLIVPVQLLLLRHSLNIKLGELIKTYIPIICSTLAMLIAGVVYKQFATQLLSELVAISICIVVYCTVLLTFPNSKKAFIFFFRRDSANEGN